MRTAAVVAALLLHASAAAAQRRRAPARVCIPGAQVSCACPNGGTGVQRCNADGTGLDACRCLPTPSAPPAVVVEPAAPLPAPRILAAPTARPTRVHWYGYQTLIFDAGATILGAIALGIDSVPVAFTSGVVSLLGPPIVHMAHGQFGTAAIDVGLRLLPIGLIYFANRNFTDPDDVSNAVIAAGVLQALVIASDAAFLARETIRDPPNTRARSYGGGVYVLRDGAALTFSGAF